MSSKEDLCFISDLKNIYDSNVVSSFLKDGCSNIHQVPKLEKVVLNMSVSGAVSDRKKLTSALEVMGLIAGQKPVATIAKKSVAAFKLREGMKIGCKVTLRKKMMYNFLDRLLDIALPSVRDFDGLSSSSFDGRGNYAFGIEENIVFPEIEYGKAEDIRGLDVVICTTAKNNQDALRLLRELGFPLR